MKKLIFLLVFFAITIIILSNTVYTQTDTGYFTITVVDENFCMYTTDPQTIQDAIDNFNGLNYLHPHGPLLAGDGGFNQPWSWHLDPADVRMVEVSMELCDGRPSYVEKDLDYWLDTVKFYCPWSGRVTAIGCENISSTTTTPSPPGGGGGCGIWWNRKCFVKMELSTPNIIAILTAVIFVAIVIGVMRLVKN